MTRLSVLALASAALVGCANSYEIEGLKIISRSTMFEPGVTIVMQDDVVLSIVGGPPGAAQLAGAAGQVGAAALSRPSRTSTQVSVQAGAFQVQGQEQSQVGGGQFVPPGHVDNPSENH